MSLGGVIRGNSIYANGRAAAGTDDDYAYNPGISESGGRTPNYIRRRTNFPTSTLVKYTPTSQSTFVRIIGTLKSLPTTSFTLDFYLNPSASLQDVRQGKTYLGSTIVTTDDAGFTGFDVILDTSTSTDSPISATATGPEGTSELEFMSSVRCCFSRGSGGPFPAAAISAPGSSHGASTPAN